MTVFFWSKNSNKNDDNNKKKSSHPPRKCKKRIGRGSWWGWMMRWEWEREDEGDDFFGGMDGLEWKGENLGKEVR